MINGADQWVTGPVGVRHSASIGMGPGWESRQENLWSGPTGDFPPCSHKDVWAPRGSQPSLALCVLLRIQSKVTNGHLYLALFPLFQFVPNFRAVPSPQSPTTPEEGSVMEGKSLSGQ